jgi:hypothetical protein
LEAHTHPLLFQDVLPGAVLGEEAWRHLRALPLLVEVEEEVQHWTAVPI